MSDNTTLLDAQAPVFDRLGHIVRSLHDALRELGADGVLAEAANELPNARERLVHIGQLTERAANTVLNKVDEASPVQEALANDAKTLLAAWQNLPSSAVGPDAAELLGKTTQFLASAHEGCNNTKSALSDMMMAQDFQDLTGQLIKKVVVVLERTENDLLRLLLDAAPPGAVTEVKKEELMAGPGAPGSVALDQSSVDDLLADLGF
jgi:chemotaxis protein CheZ